MNAIERQERIARLRRFPSELETLIAGLTPEQLAAAPLAGEWSVAQNVHHLVDSHMNSFIRLKLILNENHPTLKPYNQDDWARSAEYKLPVAGALAILRGLHERWAALYEALQPSDWVRTGFHPHNGIVSADTLLQSYSDHCDAHIDQITRTIAAGKA
jgi:hypothetical protein